MNELKNIGKEKLKMMLLGLRILKLFDFCFKNNLAAGVCWHDKEFHITIIKGGKICASGQNKTLTLALDECSEGLKKFVTNKGN